MDIGCIFKTLQRIIYISLYSGTQSPKDGNISCLYKYSNAINVLIHLKNYNLERPVGLYPRYKD